MKFNPKSFLGSSSGVKHDSFKNVAARVWNKIHMMLFFLLLIGFIAAGWRIWQQSLSGAGWSQQKKQDYLNSQNKEITFKEKEFVKTIEDMEARQRARSEEYRSIKNIFLPYN